MLGRQFVQLLLVGTAVGCVPTPGAPPALLSGDALYAGTIEIVSLTPSPGSVVDSATVIEAELRYSVVDVRSYPGPYSVDVFFGTDRGPWIRPATPDERVANRPIVVERNNSEGRAKVRYPLASVLGQPGLMLPLTVHFTVSDGSGRSPAVLAAEASGRIASPVQGVAHTTVVFTVREPGRY